MQPFTTLSYSNRILHLDRLRIEHKILHQKEKQREFAKRPPCPYCNQTHVFKYGISPAGLTRYQSSACKKSYTTRSGTPAHWLHLRTKFDKYMYDMMFNGHRPLKTMAAEFNISFVTAFDWRHKILASLNCTPKQFQGLVELRNSILPFSRKGIGRSKAANTAPEKTSLPVQIIITADTEYNASIHVARIGKLKATDIEVRLKNRFSRDAAIVSRVFEDKTGKPHHQSMAIKQFSKSNHLSIQQFSNSDNPLDLDDKNSSRFDSDLKSLIFKKTRGVSSKYLQHYADWTTLMRMRKEIKVIQAELYHNQQGLAAYTAREAYFQQFMQEFAEIEHVRTSHWYW